MLARIDKLGWCLNTERTKFLVEILDHGILVATIRKTLPYWLIKTPRCYNAAILQFFS